MKNSVFESSLLIDKKSLVCEATVTLQVSIADGEHLPVDIRISSDGVLDLYREMIALKPLPPRKFLVVKADSDEGIELGLEEDQLQIVPDYADPEYLKEMEEYHLDLMLTICGHAVVLKGHNGSPNEKCELLLRRGLTLEQLSEIFSKVIQLGKTKDIEAQNYMATQMGLTKDVLNKINKRARKAKSGTVSSLFNKVNLMKDFGIDIMSLPQEDQSLIAYGRLLDNHMQAEAIEEQQKEMKRKEAMDRTAGKIPKPGRNGTFNGGF